MATNNYTLGQARLYWKTPITATVTAGMGTLCDKIYRSITGNSGYEKYDMGNITAVEIVPDVTYLDHYVSSGGARQKDKTVAITKDININLTFDEFSATNMKNFFAADKYGDHLTVFQSYNMPVEGAGVVVFYTDVGTDFAYVIPKAALRTEGGFSLNSEDWSEMPYSLQILRHSTFAIAEGATLAPFGYIDMSATSGDAPGV